MLNTKIRKSAPIESRDNFRLRKYFISAMLALSLATAGCTPAELENTLGQLQQSFESGDIEGAFNFTAYSVIPFIGMRLGLPIGF